MTAATGPFVVSGEAECLVVATGTATTLAGITQLAETAERPTSPLADQLNLLVRVVAVIAASAVLSLAPRPCAGPAGHDAFLFGVGVGGALVPDERECLSGYRDEVVEPQANRAPLHSARSGSASPGPAPS